MKHLLSRDAELDLEEIWSYTATEWGLLRAEQYVGEILETFEILSRNPLKGRSIEGARPGYRMKSSGKHTIFYRALSDHLEVIRVLHQRMDPSRYL